MGPHVQHEAHGARRRCAALRSDRQRTVSPEVIGLLIAAAGFLAAFITTIVKFTDRLTKAEGALDAARTAVAKAEAVGGELSEFKEQVAREYVTGAAIERVEARLVSAIERLGDRLDRAFEGRPAATRTRATPK